MWRWGVGYVAATVQVAVLHEWMAVRAPVILLGPQFEFVYGRLEDSWVGPEDTLRAFRRAVPFRHMYWGHSLELCCQYQAVPAQQLAYFHR